MCNVCVWVQRTLNEIFFIHWEFNKHFLKLRKSWVLYHSPSAGQWAESLMFSHQLSDFPLFDFFILGNSMQTFASNSFHGTNIWENNSWEIEWVGGNNSLANNPWQENNLKVKFQWQNTLGPWGNVLLVVTFTFLFQHTILIFLSFKLTLLWITHTLFFRTDYF